MTPRYTQKKHKDGSVYRIPYYRCTKTMHFDNSVCQIKAALMAPEQSEALQCVLKSVTVHPQKIDFEIFELQEFPPGSQNRKEWLRGLDSNQDNQLQRLACYQLHYPGTGYKSVADPRLICYPERTR
jgi:hypothetical protein